MPFLRRALLAFLGALALTAASEIAIAQSESEVVLTSRQTRFTFQHPQFKMEVDAASGGRIVSWKLSGNGRELANEPEGLLLDSFFGTQSYRAAIMHPGPVQAVLRLVSDQSNGLRITKTLTVEAATSRVTVRYQIENLLQAPFHFTASNRLNLHKPAVDQSPSAEGNTILALDESDRAGIAFCLGNEDLLHIDPASPAIGWSFPDVQPGRMLIATLQMAPISDGEPTGTFSEVAARKQTPIEGWKSDSETFPISDDDRARGFWISVGKEESRRKLDEPQELDLALDDARYLPLELNALEDQNAPLRVTVPPEWNRRITPFIERSGHERLELIPPGDAPLILQAGARCRLWLEVSGGTQAGDYQIPVGISIGDRSAEAVLHLKVWNTPRPTDHAFHVRGYSSGIEYWNGGSEITEEKTRRLEVIMKTFSEMGGTVFEWNTSMKGIAAHVRLKETGETLASIVAKEPTRLDFENLPELDFSHYDPWLESAKKYGLTRVDTYSSFATDPNRNWRFTAPMVGAGRVEPGSTEDRKVTVWYLTQLRRYFESRGFKNLFCKISDEMGPEKIAGYTQMASWAKEAGWRPFTTITGMIARTAGHIKLMDPYCDQWQLGSPLKDDFLDLLQKRYTVTEKEFAFPAWEAGAKSYANGGAVDTYGVCAFGPGSFTGIPPESIESIEVYEEGKLLPIHTGSAWGNKIQGRVITGGALNSHLYISPSGGAHASQRGYSLKVKVREESDDGTHLASINPEDEIWYYGGPGRPYMTPYETAWAFPLMAPYQQFDGYGIWAFLEWQRTERIVWMNDAGTAMTVSPAYCGYRDGWRDAMLLSAISRKHGSAAFAGIIGDDPAAALQADRAKKGHLNYRDVRNANDPVARNLARRRALALLAGGQ